VAPDLLVLYKPGTRVTVVYETLVEGLTDREREVLTILLQSPSPKEIARRLGCSVKTIEFHLRNIRRKANSPSRLELAFALLRQHESAPSRSSESAVVYGPFAVNLSTHEVMVEGERVDLTRSQVLALVHLIRAAGRPVPSEQLQALLGALSSLATERQMQRLRRRLGRHADAIKSDAGPQGRTYTLG
jgi:DNA-binding CsgD family transcriptional regulator